MKEFVLDRMILKDAELVFLLLCLLPLLLPSLSRGAGSYEITWYTIDGGGGTSSGGPYVLTGTIGQPDGDWCSGGPYELLGGFWPGGPIISPDCFPSTYSRYNDWVALGKPDCWCWQYQCDGDVDGATETFFNYRVYGKDLAAVVANWKKKADDPTLNPCADIDHKAETVFNYRVYGKDLATVVANWKKTDAQLPGNCPRPE
jgi:hypothetical protein